MSVKLKYYLKNVIFCIFTAAALVMAFAPFGKEAAVHKRASEIYLTTPDPEPLLININTATVRELQKLNGVGEVLSAAIIEYREEHGAFKTVDELDNVYGIGEVTVEKLRPYVIV